MGYITIEHLYKHPEFFLLGGQICVMEKIHGTSTWISSNGSVSQYHSGGETEESFGKLFDKDQINQELKKILLENNWKTIRVHGEAYGGKQQKMKDTYGDKLKFIVFDILVSDSSEYFLDYIQAEKIAARLNLEFVHYCIGPNTAEWIEEQTNLPSVQAERNGMGTDRLREGVVVKPIKEMMFNGKRAILKHKCGPFWETKKPGVLLLGQSTKLVKLSDLLETSMTDAEIADNWVTSMRADHVLDHLLANKPDPQSGNKKIEVSDINTFIDMMLSDIKKESVEEIQEHEWTKKLIREIRKKSMSLLKQKVNTSPDDELWSQQLLTKINLMKF